ncbi:MAG: TolB family protein [Acidobacteriaceae bacterium]|nr:TolB family protein [Acidobacteriaceae bacterium]
MHRRSVTPYVFVIIMGCGALYAQSQSPWRLRSKLSIYDLATKSVRIIYSSGALFEAPNWSPDGKFILFNEQGKLFLLSVNGEKRTEIDLKGLLRCNNDKGFSPDGKQIAFSSTGKAKGSQVFTVPSTGGEPRLIVPETPSYFHAYSPDGKYLAFVAQRNGNFDLFRIPAVGGQQEQLTMNAAYDDGPDYSPDGKWIYFNSNRSGKWEVWRMPADGAGQNDAKAEQVTFDEVEDWFPHCSPDGKWLVFVTFPKGTKTHNERMPGVELRIMRLPGEKLDRATSELLVTFFGGQGSINVNSWAPDSQKFAFVSFEAY